MSFATNLPSNNCTMGMRFKQIAQQHAARPALQCADQVTDYAALDDLSDKVAMLLQQEAVGAGDVVAIHAEKSLLTYASMLAALKIGAPYVVLDTSSPAARLDKILSCCLPKLILSDRPFSWQDKKVVQFEELKAAPTPENISIALADDGNLPAYIMFTSGSTGFPKGVTISHASMLNFCDWSRETFDITVQDKLTGANALYFDNSVFDFTASLFNGACLVPVDRDTVSNPKQLVEAVRDCTIWFSVPSLLIYVRVLKALQKESWPHMRSIIFGGEGFPKSELKKLYELVGNQATLWNVYGPTECTCICSAYAVAESDFEDMEKLAPLGHLAKNFTGRVMDEAGQTEVTKGETGELFLMGPQVALGYYNDDERSKEAFAANPLQPDVSCYHTGDLVYQDTATGYYNFIGRRDNQIKHMGYRIELEEIEAALASIDGVTQSSVFYQKKSGAGGAIIACVQALKTKDSEGIKTKLREILPAYMVPEVIHICDELPKNANGKVDRNGCAEIYKEGQ